MTAKKQITASFLVTVVLPQGANIKLGQDYVREAVKSHCGGYDKSDTMAKLDRESVKVALHSTTTQFMYHEK